MQSTGKCIHGVSGSDEQVEAGGGVDDHHREQGELSGELAPPWQQLDGPVVGGDHPQHMAGDDREDLDDGKKGRVR